MIQIALSYKGQDAVFRNYINALAPEMMKQRACTAALNLLRESILQNNS